MWGSQTFNLKPDMITSAKALSASLAPISALLVNERIFQAMVAESGKLGGYAGHPVMAAVALETLKIYEEIDIVRHVQAVEPTFLEVIGGLTSHPLVGHFCGTGLIGGIEIVADKETSRGHDAALRSRTRSTRMRAAMVSFCASSAIASPSRRRSSSRRTRLSRCVTSYWRRLWDARHGNHAPSVARND